MQHNIRFRSHLVPGLHLPSRCETLCANEEAILIAIRLSLEINLVNITENSTTIDRISAEAEIDGKWIALKFVSDLSNYEIAFDDEQLPKGPFSDAYARIEKLTSLWDKLKGVELKRGVSVSGWVDFEVDIPEAQLDKPVQHKIRLVDALGGTHPVIVLASNPPDKSGRIKHSDQVYSRLRQ